MLHTITITGRRISGINPNRFVQNGINADEVTLSVDDEWYDLDQIIITLQNSAIAEPVSLIWYKEPVVVPATLLAEIGTITVSVAGYRDGMMRVLTEKMTSGLGQVIQSGEIGDVITVPGNPDLDRLTARVTVLENKVDELTEVPEVVEEVAQKVEEVAPVVEEVAQKVAVVDEVVTKVSEVEQKVAVVDEVAAKVSEVEQKVAVVDEVVEKVATLDEVEATANEALEKAEQALAGGGSGTRGPSISLGSGRPINQTGIAGDSYLDKSTGQLWEFVEV